LNVVQNSFDGGVEMRGVLLVDDDSHFRRSLAIGLEVMGYRVCEAGSGMEALEFLRENQIKDEKVSGVVLDARMPGLDGFLLADQIVTMYPSLRVVILSAHSYSVRSDNYTVLTKPIDLKRLIKVLDRDMSSVEER
jgi:DNA-binding NtrC family response regulator